MSTTSERPELFFAVVGAAGTRLSDLAKELRKALETFGYEAVDIRLSDLLKNYVGYTEQSQLGEAERILHLQEVGNEFRAALGDGAAVARAGMAAIRERRASITGSPDCLASSHAYILHQLKNPAEADLLRTVYGSSFALVAGHSPRGKRVEELARRMARVAAQPEQESRFRVDAERIIENDEKQKDGLGQNTRDTYPKADFFANLGLEPGDGEMTILRFIELLFGHPFHTPLPEEFMMYQASAVALRSSDDNRQVGAVVANLVREGHNIRSAEVVASGMNEVPRARGGYYWHNDSPDNRDQALLARGEKRATEIKESALAELIGRIREKNWLGGPGMSKQSDSELARALLAGLSGTQFMDIGEFSRLVHAEMAALIDAARRGVPVDGHSLYVTTFPCHNCAKHVIAAGIRRVVYLEPYPKSRAGDLHREEISLESVDGREDETRVVFLPFSGIAPRQYRQLFLMSERGAKKGNSISVWTSNKRSLVPVHVLRNASLAYLAAEAQEVAVLQPNVYRKPSG